VLRTVPSVNLARSLGFLRYGAAGAVSAVYAAKAPATPDADEARRAAEKEFSRPIYHDHHDLWDRIWSWLREHFNTDGMVPGVPSWMSTVIVVLVVAAAGITTDREWICTRSVKTWKQTGLPDLGKTPAIFLIYA